MNVLDLPGPEFLRLYLVLFAAGITLSFLVRWWLRYPGGAGDLPPAARLPDLHPFEVAYLAGGPKAVADAAIASLVHQGNLRVEMKPARLVAGGALSAGTTPLERAVFRAVTTAGTRVAAVRREVRDTARAAAGRLESLGLVLHGPRSLLVQLAPAAVLLGLFVVGFAKVLVGVTRERPVGFLVLLCAAVLITAFVFCAVRARRTRLGSRVLHSLKRHNAALRTTASRSPDNLAPNDLAMAFALFGAGAFAFGPMSDLRRALAPPTSGGSGCGGGSSGCGSGSCGGGGGGCGGCGGGA